MTRHDAKMGSWLTHIPGHTDMRDHHCFFFSRNIGWLTLKNIHFHYLQIFSGSKYPKNILFNFEKKSTGDHDLSDSTPGARICVRLQKHRFSRLTYTIVKAASDLVT